MKNKEEGIKSMKEVNILAGMVSSMVKLGGSFLFFYFFHCLLNLTYICWLGAKWWVNILVK